MARAGRSGFVLTLIGLCELVGFEWRFWLCEAIDRIRPGRGHEPMTMCDPPACRWCGASVPRRARL